MPVSSSPVITDFVLTWSEGGSGTHNEPSKFFLFLLRCDGKTDCKDLTDEMDCRVIEFDSSYNKFLSPPVEAGETKLSVLASVSLHSVSSLDPVLASYEAEFTVTLRWRDERLSFNNLRAESNMNSIRPAETEKIWFPEFYFDNTEEKVMAVIDDSAVLRVLRNGSGGLSSSEDTENKLIFRGGENWLQYQRFYSQIFHCDFYLHWYPFDIQTCYLDIKPASDIRVI